MTVEPPLLLVTLLALLGSSVALGTEAQETSLSLLLGSRGGNSTLTLHRRRSKVSTSAVCRNLTRATHPCGRGRRETKTSLGLGSSC
jgi:hypothetical protein